jgi:hypothetical protein
MGKYIIIFCYRKTQKQITKSKTKIYMFIKIKYCIYNLLNKIVFIKGKNCHCTVETGLW